MDLTRLWRLLHLFFAFSFVGSLVVAEWNGRAARAVQDWSQRALLFHIVYLASRIAGLGSLLMLGVFGNVLSVRLGYSMRNDAWMLWVNGLWLVLIAITLLVVLPNARRIYETSRQAAGGSPPSGFDAALARWRFGNVLQSALYLVLLILMVFHWGS